MDVNCNWAHLYLNWLFALFHALPFLKSTFWTELLFLKFPFFLFLVLQFERMFFSNRHVGEETVSQCVQSACSL